MDISGIINIYKSTGPTSHDIVDRIRKIIKPLLFSTNEALRRKRLRIGHAGTLDPFAEGVLIILIGKATRLQSKFMDMPKTYTATLKLGVTSDTYDKTGVKLQTPNTKSQTISKPKIQNILKNFIGEINQMPPDYSAIKIKGKKAYELARKGIKPKLKPRKVKIYKIKLIKYKWPYLEIEVRCGKGTYIRSLAHDIGKKLGCGAYLEELTRTKIGKFSIKNSVKLEELDTKNLPNKIIPVKINEVKV